MCGIAGIVGLSGRTIEWQAHLEAMLLAEQHRGPDDAGLEFVNNEAPGILFGHRRLAIIDLSEAGHQPMRDPETGSWITYNGEIYNYRQLRSELENCGQVFQTQTDTEVILKAYAAWGPACLQRLRGIFAFGLWDKQTHSLVLARDQLGVKPLYIWRGADRVLFASEVRALLASGEVPRRLDLNGLHSYLAFGSVQEPFTLVRNVFSLPPGCYAIWRDGQWQVENYWQPPAEAAAQPSISEAHEHVGSYLAEAVRLQLVSDVPLGVFLSGGIDSTAIAALAQRASTQPIRTFSLVFDETAYDERQYSRRAAQFIGTEHTELHLTPELVINALPAALQAFDQPSMDGMNTYFISKVTREAGLTVALSGVGGDELFVGYNDFNKARVAEKWGRWFRPIPALLRQPLAWPLSHLARREDLRKLADLLDAPEKPYLATRRVLSEQQISQLINPDAKALSESWSALAYDQLFVGLPDYDTMNLISVLELRTYMLNTLLRDTDQMSMAHALEVRVPLIDHELVEYVLSLSSSYKLRPNHPKALLTLPLNGSIPDECVFRPKRGFTLPFALWLKQEMQAEVKSKLLTPDASPAPFEPKGLQSLWSQFEHGQVSWSRVWSLFVLRYWLERYQIVA